MKTIKLFELKKNKSDFERVKITSSKDAYNVIRKFYYDDISIYESFFILMLDRSNNTIGYAKISQGGIVGTVVDLKLIAKYCIDSLCSSVILAHNHPSGNLTPSIQDKEITKKIKNGLNLLEVTTFDHLIITEESYYSFSDNSEL
jgi:DNA repair protein RadC